MWLCHLCQCFCFALPICCFWQICEEVFTTAVFYKKCNDIMMKCLFGRRKTGNSQLVKKNMMGNLGFLQGTDALTKVTEALGDLLAVHRRQVIPNLCLVPPASWPNSTATEATVIRCLSQQANIIQHSSHTD